MIIAVVQALRLEFSRFCAEDFTPQLMRKHHLNNIFQQIQVTFYSTDTISRQCMIGLMWLSDMLEADWYVGNDVLQELSSGSRSGVISRDSPLHVDHINRFWDRFSAAMRDKDLAIQAELSRSVEHLPSIVGV